MKRRSCTYFNNNPRKGPRVCEHGYKCSDSCADYTRKKPYQTFIMPLSLCMFRRYRYTNNVKRIGGHYTCAIDRDIKTQCKEGCGFFMRRPKERKD